MQDRFADKLNVALLPPAVTPLKMISGCLSDGSGVSSLRFSNGVSEAVNAVVPAGSAPNSTATW